jgi:predicted ATPase
MITRVKVKYFKRFEDQTFDLTEHVVLAGPNNSGKTTLLQAIAVWNLSLQKWRAERGPETGSKAKLRTGVPLTRDEFTAIPLREVKFLWTNTLTALRTGETERGQKPGHPRVLEITLEGQTTEGPWKLTFELRYQNSALVYVRPTTEQIDDLQAAQDIKVVHIPPFSGIGIEETRYDRPFQDLRIGQGKPGDILRNLLLEVYQQDNKDNWKNLCQQVEEIFGYRLLPPQYEGLPYILCEYLPGIPKGKGKNGLPQLDVSSAGSGFLQVLTLLGFLYARPATVLLLDEPDAHLHVILQKQIYDRLRRIVAERKCQLIIATHSEVLVDGTSPDQVISFYGSPHPLLADVERDQVREALKRLTAMDILLAEEAPGVLYVESESDFNLLSAWAQVLNHQPICQWLAQSPYWHSNQGCHPREARDHFFALRAIKPQMKGYLLLDGDNRGLADREIRADGLVIGRWKRYETKSYLIHPEALRRYAEEINTPLFASAGMEYLRDELPGAVLRDPLGDHDYLNRTPASKTLLPGFFKAAQVTLQKNDYYLVAEQMGLEEIAAEVKQKLDDIARAFGFDA